MARGGEGEGEVDRGRRFADAALAAGHRDDEADPGGKRLLGLRRLLRASLVLAGPGLLRRRGRAVGGQDGGDGDDPVEGKHRLFGGFADRLHRRAFLRADLDGETHVAVADDQARDHAERDDILAAFGVEDPLKPLSHLGFADLRHS